MPRSRFGRALRVCWPWFSRPALLLAKTLAVLIPLTGLGLGLAYLRLLHGPISLHVLLTPMEQALKTELPGVVIDVEDAIVRLSERGRIEFRLKNIKVHENDGDILALAPLAAIRLSTRALLRGRIAPSRIELIEPRFLIARDADGQLSLSFARAGTLDEPVQSASAEAPPRSTARVDSGGSAPATPFRRLDLARTLSEASARARRRVDAASFLSSVGLMDAVLIYDSDGRRSVWRMPEFDLRLKHESSSSIISGSGRVAAAEGEWTFRFRTEDQPSSKTLRVDAAVQDLVPRAIAQGSGHLAMLQGIDLPISGSGSIELSADGEVLRGQFGLDLEPGQVYLPWLDHLPHNIGSGRLDVRYAGDMQRFDLGPSTLSWGKSHAVVGGSLVHAWAPDGRSAGWQFDLRTLSGVIASEDLDVAPLPIDQWVARGRLGPEPGRLRLDGLELQAGGAQISMNGHVASLTDRIEGRLEGRIGPMPIASLKALWPSPLARRTRAWAGTRLVGGTLKGGSFTIATSRDVGRDVRQGADPSGRRLSLTLEAADIEIGTTENLPPLQAARVLVRIEDTDAEVTIPEASFATPSGERIALRSGRIFATEIASERPQAELSVRAQAPLAAALELLSREPFSMSRETGVTLQGVDGKAEAQVRVSLPLGGEAISAADMKLEGRLRITDGRAKDVFANHDIHGATVVVDATEKSIDVKGDMLLAGVSMKLAWQRLIGVPDAEQPPIKLSARLDDSDRAQLGLDLNHMVHGEVPVEVSIRRAGRTEPHVHLVADLTGAELVLSDISWRKPPGRPATLQFDAAKGRQNRTELQNFRLDGENIAIEGWVGLGPDNHATEYHFPNFSLNVVTNLDVRGALRPGRVWEVKAQGKTYDGTELFRRLIAFGEIADHQQHAKDRPGLDLTADIDTVLGVSDTAIRGVKLRMQKRAEQLTMLDLRAMLDGGKPLTARLRQEQGRPRVFVAETPDAGQALKLVGLYSNMIDGAAELEVNLDAKGAAERSGVLTIRSFRVLGDPIVAEVLQTADGSRPAIDAGRAANRRVVREQFDFDRLRAPFSMGNGQLVLENAHVTGPLIGATIRGKLDYKSRRVQLGGTYVPLSEFNRSFAPIPLLGPLLTGPRGEGVLGITFAIEGPMANPQVIVNPLSFVMPGIFREIFQMTPENPRITPRDDRQNKSGRSGPQVRASPPKHAGSGQPGSSVDAEVLGGWSAETTGPSPNSVK